MILLKKSNVDYEWGSEAHGGLGILLVKGIRDDQASVSRHDQFDQMHRKTISDSAVLLF